MKPLENYKLNNIKNTPKQNTNQNNQNPKQNLKESENKNIVNKNNNRNLIIPLSNQTKNLRYKSNTNTNPTNKKENNIQSSNILNPLTSSPKPTESNKLSNTPPPQMSEREKEEFERTQKYINYLKEHLNSSYYANNEINNKNNILTEKSKSLNEEIKNNNTLYQNLLKSVEEKTKINEGFKKQYQNFVGGAKKIEKDTEVFEKVNNLKQKNYILNKENQSKEEIILNLKKTLEILEKSEMNKKVEKEKKMKELKEKKDDINKLKLNIGKITKELYTKNIKLEEKKKSMLYILNKNNENENDKLIDLKNESNDLLSKEVIKIENVIENQKLLLKKMKENQNDIKQKINEQKMINNNINKDYSHKQLLLEEKIKNKDLIMNIIKSNEEAKELSKLHNQIKNMYEIKINKIKDDIEKILASKKEENIGGDNNIHYNSAINQLLDEQKNLKMFNKEFKEKLVIKKAIEDKIELMQKENNKLKNIINNHLKSNNNNNDVDEVKNNDNLKDNENDKDKDEEKENDEENSKENDDQNSKENDEENEVKENNINNKNNIIQQNQIKLKYDNTKITKDSSIFTITDTGKLFTFNIIQKKFTTFNTKTINGWEQFIEIYLTYYDGSLLLNTLDGLYILTGDNFSALYYYSQQNNSISKITSFDYGHKYGGLIQTPDKKSIIAIGGIDTKDVEIFNIENHTIEELPNLLSERINSSYSFIGETLYAFLGQKNNTIECIDINDEQKEWKNIEFENNEVDNVYGHISVPVNEEEILIVGGKNNHKMMMFNVKNKFLEITNNKIPFLDTVGEYIFDKDKNYNIINNMEKRDEENDIEINQALCMDSKGNVHLSDKDFNYIVLLVDIHNI